MLCVGVTNLLSWPFIPTASDLSPMDLLSGLNRNLDYSERLKDELTIGLFGSFRRSHLEALKRHLREREGFNARVSYDLTASHPRVPGEDDRAYDFRLAKILIEESQVDIVHFFREEEDEYGINDSSTLEIGILWSKRRHPSRAPLRPHPLRGRLRCQEHRGHAARHTAPHRERVALARF